MDMKLVVAIIAFGFCFATAKADAQYYLEGNIGVSILMDSDIDSDGIPFEGRFDEGYVVKGALGYSFGKYRLEGEISYRDNEFDDLIQFCHKSFGV